MARFARVMKIGVLVFAIVVFFLFDASALRDGHCKTQETGDSAFEQNEKIATDFINELINSDLDKKSGSISFGN